MPRAKALVAEADPAVRRALRSVLDSQPIEISESASREDADQRLQERAYDLLLVDLDDPTFEGLGGDADSLPVRIGIGRPVAGAGEFERVSAPSDREALAGAVSRGLRHAAALAEIRRLRTLLRAGEEQLVGASPAMEALRSELERACGANRPLWLAGETGTGKALAARLLHDRSHRAERPFVAVHAATVSADVWPDLLEQAQDGTLFVEDAGGLDPEVQRAIVAQPPGRARLLLASVDEPRRLEERGELLAACRKQCAAATLRLPPLRERRDDIPLLARHFVKTVADLNRMPPVRLSPGALERLTSHRWPGNVQELRNAMEHAVILAPDGEIRVQDLPEAIRTAQAPAGLASKARRDLAARAFREVKREIVSEFEGLYLQQLLDRFAGNVTVAARHAGMLRSALQRLLRKHGLRSTEFRRRDAAERGEGRADVEARPD